MKTMSTSRSQTYRGMLATAMLGMAACASTSADEWGPMAAPMEGPYAETIGVRTTIVLDAALLAKTFKTENAYPQGTGKPAVHYELRTGAGMKRSLEDRLGKLFVDHLFVSTVDQAMAGDAERGQPELILWPQLLEASVDDQVGNATATVSLRDVLLTGGGLQSGHIA